MTVMMTVMMVMMTVMTVLMIVMVTVMTMMIVIVGGTWRDSPVHSQFLNNKRISINVDIALMQ